MADYWISTSGGTLGEYGYDIAVDSRGNVYVIGTTASTGAGLDDFLITKYNNGGTIEWQRTLGGADYEYGNGIAVDGSGNVYVTGYTWSHSAGNADLFVAKYNTSGTIQWQRVLVGTVTDVGRSIAVDSSGNVYITGYTTSQGAGVDDMLVVKYNSSGIIQWQIRLGDAAVNQGRGIAVDGSGNIYVGGYTDTQGANGFDCLIVKYNSSGTLQWQRRLGGTATDTGQDIAVDSSGNVYVFGNTNSQGAGSSDFLIAKYDTSGTIQWQRTLGGTGGDYSTSIAVDSSGNVYITGNASTGVNGDLLVAKYNTSGTIQWQRILGGASIDQGYGIAVDGSGNVYIGGHTASTGAGSYDLLVAKLPGDGSLTGVYGPFTYAVSTLTAATSTLTDAAATLTAATSTLTDAAATLTDMDIITKTSIR